MHAPILTHVAGIAFRMSQDLGFQCDPRYWVDEDQTIASPEDIEIRRRLYWGCFSSDEYAGNLEGLSSHVAHNGQDYKFHARPIALPT